jgi:uncharacterized protein DUF1045
MLDRAQYRDESKGAPQPSFVRYAVFYTPQPGTALSAFGRSWFGRANDGATLEAFSESGLSSGFSRLPTTLSRYSGLHAVFKQPFALKSGTTADALKARLVSFTHRRKPVATGPLTLSRAGRFLVLRPVRPAPALDWLAAQCVTTFDSFAAPLSEIDREERMAPHHNDYQRLLFESYGDTNVLSEYRFHITLTGPLDNMHLERVAQALWPVIEEICAAGVTVDALSLFGDPGGRTPLKLIGRHRLGS